MPLKDIRSQERAVEILKSGLEQKKIAHAYLFLGPKGSRRFRTALEFVKLLNCENKGDDCRNSCLSCIRIEKNGHPDLYVISKDKNKSQISINSIRRLQNKFSLKPFEARYKAAIILDAEDMTEEASNSLLKMLEEPACDTVFILIASNQGALLDTVISRCQIIRFRPLTKNEVNEILIKDFSIEAKEAKFLSAISDANIEKALSLKENNAVEWKNSIIDEFSLEKMVSTLFLGSKDKRSKIELTPFFTGKRDLQLDAMEVLSGFYRDILVYKFTGDENLVINIDRLDIISDLAKKTDTQKLQKSIEFIDETRQLLEANCNGKLVIRILQEKLGDWSQKEEDGPQRKILV